MLNYFFSLFACILLFQGMSQTDSTDLELYMSDPVIEDELDSMLYEGLPFGELNLDFTVSDTLSFDKLHIEIIEVEGERVILRKSYPLEDLEADALIEAWEVSIPFGNLLNTSTYEVAVIIERYDGSLGATITKQIAP